MLLQRHPPGADLEITSIDRNGRIPPLFARVINALQKGDSKLGISCGKDKSLGTRVDELMESTCKKLMDHIVPLLDLAPAIFKYKETVRNLSGPSNSWKLLQIQCHNHRYLFKPYLIPSVNNKSSEGR